MNNKYLTNGVVAAKRLYIDIKNTIQIITINSAYFCRCFTLMPYKCKSENWSPLNTFQSTAAAQKNPPPANSTQNFTGVTIPFVFSASLSSINGRKSLICMKNAGNQGRNSTAGKTMA